MAAGKASEPEEDSPRLSAQESDALARVDRSEPTLNGARERLGVFRGVGCVFGSELIPSPVCVCLCLVRSSLFGYQRLHEDGASMKALLIKVKTRVEINASQHTLTHIHSVQNDSE